MSLVAHIVLVPLLSPLAAVPPPSAAGMTAGTAVVDITPPVGYRMSGYFNERLGTGTHDPLHAKAIVLQQGATQAALVFCDLIGLPLDVSSRARKLAARKTGIPASNILIAATHTHTAPLYFGALREHFHQTATAANGRDPQETVDYAAELGKKLVDAITQAQAGARPVRVEAGIAQQTGLSFNRRYHMKDGTVRFNPGPLNPDIVQPAGPIDPDVGIVLLRRVDDGYPAAALVNFAMHLDTVGGTLYGADYPFYLEQSLRETFGDGFVTLFATGTCGDINHIDVTRETRPRSEQIGDTLADTIRAALPGLDLVAAPALAVRSVAVKAPLQKRSGAQVAQARRDMPKIGTSELPFLDQVNAYKVMSLKLRGGSAIKLEVQVFRLSDEVAVVGLPGEVFVELGLAIKKASPFRTTLVIELCNDAPEYIPTKKAFAEGSYETVNSWIAPGGGEMLAEAAIRELSALKRASR